MKISNRLFLLVLMTLCAVPAYGQARRIEKIQDKEVVGGEIIVRFRPTAVGAISTIRQDPDTVSLDPLGRNGDVLIRSRQRIASELLQTYSSRADVEFAEPNRIWHKTDIPNDPAFQEQWYLQNTGQTTQSSTGLPGADTHAVTAWNTTLGSKNIVVGVIDSGINYNHTDLSDNVWSAPVAFDVTIGGQVVHCNVGTHGFNAITRTCDPVDDEGHGTAMAGVIGATGMNNLGITGINRISNVMGLKFLDSSEPDRRQMRSPRLSLQFRFKLSWV
jgi:subtilisin family serine protease